MAYKKIRIDIIWIKVFDSILRTLWNIKDVSKLEKIFISLATLDSNRCRYNTKSQIIKIIKEASVVIKGQKCKNLHWLEEDTFIYRAAIVFTKERKIDSIHLWHFWLNHMNEWGLTKLNKQHLYERVNSYTLDFCKHCIFEK